MYSKETQYAGYLKTYISDTECTQNIDVLKIIISMPSANLKNNDSGDFCFRQAYT